MELRELYQQLILDHSRSPRHYGALESADTVQEGFNPLCGDKITLYINRANNQVNDIQFEGCGCAISMASTSLMTELTCGKTTVEIEALFHLFIEMVTRDTAVDEQKLGKLAVLKGVCAYPARVKCATLAWHTLMAALGGDRNPVSTE